VAKGGRGNRIECQSIAHRRLSGDDSVLADTWEEIKYQVKAELSFIRLGYLDTINGVIDSAS
jgi:hypothetical protein